MNNPLSWLPVCAALALFAVFPVLSASAQADYHINDKGINSLSADTTPDTTLTGDAAARQACLLLQQQGARTVQSALDERFHDTSLLSGFSDSRVGSVLYGQGRGAMDTALHMSCAALTGADAGLSGFDADTLKEMAYTAAFSEGLGYLQSSGLPFTGRLEVSGSLFGRGASGWEILTVQPLWHDKAEQNHIFTQVSWNRTIGRAGYAEGDTLNAGLAWRRLSADRSVVYGLNAFIDHARERNHNRMSVGADVQTSQLGLSANKYIPLSSWKSVDSYIEERAASGFDLELQGRLPEFPSWQANLKAYQWSSNEEMERETTWGYDAGLQWQPVNAMIWEAGIRNEQDASPQFRTALRMVYKFGEPIEKMWERPVALADMSGRVYDRVRRDNAMRVEQRTKESAYVTVTQNIGANMAQLETGIVALSVGRQLARPFTVTVSGAPGSVARLVFQDGAVLTIGAGSQVRVEADTITLISGLFQYVSGATNVMINVPGGTVTLLGTDIDVSTDGTTSVLRVRDGSARLDGTGSGSVTLSVGEAAASVSGVVGGVLAAADPVYIAHTDEVSEKIDRVAAPQTGAKVAPYSYTAPEIVAAGDTVGDAVQIGVTFSAGVSVTGTPRLALTINGTDRVAAYSAGDSTATQLVFVYTLLAGDAGATTLTTHDIDLNGGAITSGGKAAVTTLADATLTLSGPVDPDETPDAFAFTDMTGQALSAVITSNSVTISGIPAAVAVSVSGAGSPQISINGGAWATSGTISNGQTLQVRLTSASALSTLRSATVTVGTVSDQWDVTTATTDPCAAGSPALGAICADGTIFAGTSPDGGGKMFMAAADGPSSYMWAQNFVNTSVANCLNQSATPPKYASTGGGCATGRSNSATLAAIVAAPAAPYDAARYCENLAPPDANAHGRSDWYLPSINELDVIYENLVVSHPGAYGLNTTSAVYWSSSEYDFRYAWNQYFGNGTQNYFLKNLSSRVRCVRR